MDKLEENKHKPYIESPGIPEILRDLIVTAPFNDLDALQNVIEANKGEIATVMLEPVNYNSAGIKPEPGYLETLRKITADNGILLFFDEIQSSFKKSPGGAQEDFGIMPDICAIGKSLGGGMPISAFGGKAEIMDLFKPAGNVQHSGTFNAHLIQILPALAFVDEVVKPYFYEYLQTLEKQLHNGLDKIVKELGVPVLFPHQGARYDLVMGLKDYPKHYSDLKDHDHKRTMEFIRKSNELGVYYHDYANGFSCHHGYSIQHTKADINKVLEVTEAVLKEIY
jgi:glutamate-1-semialdehyde 2,1-aminomutase